MKSGTAKVACTCKHEAQDVLHGQNIRVANATAKQDKDRVDVRCTVCNKIHSVNPARVR